VRNLIAGRSVLVTGAAGFVGSHLVEELLAAGARVRAADYLVRGKTGNLAETVHRSSEAAYKTPLSYEAALHCPTRLP
jgi:nucleoside-diphosphate-sugar epimerase